MYVIGLDIGTSSVKGVLMDENRKTVATVTRRQTYYFSNNLKLLDPDVFCENCFAVLRELKSKAKGKGIAVCASGAAGAFSIVDSKNHISLTYFQHCFNWDKAIHQKIRNLLYQSME